MFFVANFASIIGVFLLLLLHLCLLLVVCCDQVVLLCYFTMLLSLICDNFSVSVNISLEIYIYCLVKRTIKMNSVIFRRWKLIAHSTSVVAYCFLLIACYLLLPFASGSFLLLSVSVWAFIGVCYFLLLSCWFLFVCWSIFSLALISACSSCLFHAASCLFIFASSLFDLFVSGWVSCYFKMIF